MKHTIALLAALLLLSGCAALGFSDGKQATDEANILVPPGTEYTAAIEHLTRQGFTCDSLATANPVLCQRTDDFLLYRCVKTLQLYPNLARSHIVQAAPSKRDCRLP